MLKGPALENQWWGQSLFLPVTRGDGLIVFERNPLCLESSGRLAWTPSAVFARALRTQQGGSLPGAVVRESCGPSIKDCLALPRGFNSQLANGLRAGPVNHRLSCA